LYDLVNDPSEYNNLAYDPEYADIKNELARQLHQLEIEKLRVNTPSYATVSSN
jgi:hypothetical protein